ncbi:MAG: helix-turn-helix transcriptional regulator [Pseudonocardiaceae bacterium]
MSDLPDLDLLVLPGMPEALASREIATVYRLLSKHGVPQRQIAAATGQSQSEVCEILKGRQVQAYDVLVRICEGLGVPREVMGLGFGAYAVDSPARQPDGEDEADVLRRQFAHLLALAGAAVVGTPIPGVGELLANPRMPDQVSDVPSRVGRADVEVVRDLTRAVADAARSVGGQAGAATSLAGWADQLLLARASDTARQALLSALADLHVIAAWACHDSYAPGPAHHHFSQAVRMATEAQDSYRASYALRHAAMMLIDRGQPNNALKLVQLAELHLTDMPRDDPRVAPLRSWLAVIGALAQAEVAAGTDTAAARRVKSDLARARDGWVPPTVHGRADFDLITALAFLQIGAIDTAEEMAATSVKIFAAGTDRREGILADITLARVHLHMGDRDGSRLAAQAISAVTPLRSGVARAGLGPLADVLDSSKRSDLRELARRARQVTTTRV